ncbi:uncharacterized protein LOC124429558 [Vespa crabro]|uniref:uncharacterized protein LOC124429558 n=1 Tax=Vespa crabro TaxID=7445 RepID=UPI001EFF9106|nr:uncharacterized protein LOC124429558 [Vespa crabro]
MRSLFEPSLKFLLIFYSFFNHPSAYQRDKRYLVFPPPGTNAPTKVQLILGLGLPMEIDVSMIIGYVMKFNYVLPYNASYLTDSFVRYERSIDHDDSVKENNGFDIRTSNILDSPTTSRWELYEILESILENSHYGKVCLLRMICEVADVPFNRMHGLAGKLFHVLLTPSTTSDTFRTHADQEYHSAELAGRQNPERCQSIFSECPESLLEYFTEIRE